jgi:hypothetical protein
MFGLGVDGSGVLTCMYHVCIIAYYMSVSTFPKYDWHSSKQRGMFFKEKQQQTVVALI